MIITGSIRASRINKSYCITIGREDAQLVHDHKFKTLLEAIALLVKVKAKGEINQLHWQKGATNDTHDKFLIRKRGRKQKAHIWDGEDTLCRMWSTGGLKSKNGEFELHSDNQNKDICHMCQNR